MQVHTKNFFGLSLPHLFSITSLIGLAILSNNEVAAYSLSDCDNGTLVCTQPITRFTVIGTQYETGQAACDADAARVRKTITYGVLISSVYTHDPAGLPTTGWATRKSNACLMTWMYPEWSEPRSSLGATRVYTDKICVPDGWRITAGPSDTYLWAVNIVCGYQQRHRAVLPYENPLQECSVGNPIGVGSGTKSQKEVDIDAKGIGQVGLTRYFGSGNIPSDAAWHHNYDVELLQVDPENPEQTRQKGQEYHNRGDACFHGWNEIRPLLTDSWAKNSTVVQNGNLCQIKNAVGTVVKNIPIVSRVSNGYVSGVAPRVVQIRRADGSTIHYHKNGADYYPLDGSQDVLARPNSGNVMWRYSSKGGDVEDYSADGKLIAVTARNGVKQSLTYHPATNLLSKVEDTVGGSLQFNYTNKVLTSITTQNNKTTSYIYNALGLITRVTRPDSTQRIYHYEDSRFPAYLTGITDERGVRYATWTYDAQGRAISSEHAGGTDKTLLAFNADGSTTVTNALGKQTTYHFDDIAGARRVTQVEGHATASCEGANQNYTYTPEGWLASKTDWKGTTTTYSYNTLGQEISRTEAFGTSQARTITTEWHPDFYVKTRVVEGGKETLYTYDDKGRLLSTTTNPLPIQ